MDSKDLLHALGSYFAKAGSDDRQPAGWMLPRPLLEALETMAQAQQVPAEALVEHLLQKQLRAAQARLLVDEPLEPVPASLVKPAVAKAKAALTAQAELQKQMQNTRGDDSVRLVTELAHRVQELESEVEREKEKLARQRAVDEAKLEMALDESRKRDT